ncbi:MAG: hypothetical protein K5694_03600 [Bacilli bacterium]|nr:hypothetical protein [Bacilli bacterium]
MEEEKKVVEEKEAEVTEAPAEEEEESDFADEVKRPEPVKEEEPEPAKEEPKPEEEKVENGVDLYREEEKKEDSAPADPTEKIKKKEPVSYSYSDENLAKVEESRKIFSKFYTKANRIKWIMTGAVILVILAGWIIPNSIPAIKSLPNNMSFYITLIVMGVALVALFVFSHIFKKKTEATVGQYFRDYYEYTNAFVFGDKLENVAGDPDSKLKSQVLIDANLYNDIAKVGSRETLYFSYKGEEGYLVSDCAGQVRDGKYLKTVFVGKLLVTPNTYKGSQVIIYIKGGKAALPPTVVKTMNVVENDKNMAIFGEKTARRVITPALRKALKNFTTDNTFTDLAISIQEGVTYYAMGFNDDLMVMPTNSAYNPTPTIKEKEVIDNVFEIVDLLNAKGKKEKEETEEKPEE